VPDTERSRVQDYFTDWSEDYQKAVAGKGGEGSLFQGAINTLFRRKTFRIRFDALCGILDRIGIKGKSFLDIGCGPGHLSLWAAGQGAAVTAFDISNGMVALGRESAKAMGLADAVTFDQRDCYREEIPAADVVACIAVIEYYDDIEPFIRKLCDAAGEALVICDARYIWWRVFLRRILAAIKGFPLYYHDPGRVKEYAGKAGMACIEELSLHSFRIFVFRKKNAVAGEGRKTGEGG